MTRRALVAELERMLGLLVEINERVIGSQKVPPLEGSGVLYEAAATETWRTIPAVLEAGRGDAEDLACWSAAELRARGVDARVAVRERGDGALTVLVVAGGEEIDPTTLVPKAPARPASRGRR